MSDVEARLAEVLGGHRLAGLNGYCSCGWASTPTPGERRVQHDAHVAAVLAPFVADEVARAVEAAALAIDAEVTSEVARLGGKERVSANGMLNNWIGGIAAAARIIREAKP